MKTWVEAKIGWRFVLLLCLLAIATGGCTRSPEQRKAKFLARGKDFYSKKEYVRAILEFQNAVKIAPRDPEPYYQLALASLGTGDVRRAVLNLRRSLELNPKYTAAQLGMAQLMTSTGDKELLEESEKKLNELLGSSPFNEDALNILGVTEWKLGKREDAEQHLMQALNRFPSDLQAALNLVRIKLLQKDFKGAEELLKNFSAGNPKVPEPVLALGELYVVTGKASEAEQQFRRALELDPKNGMALLDLAGLQFRTGRMEDAERSYKQLSGLPDKRYSPVHAIFLFNIGKRDLAIAEFDKLAKDDPADRLARDRLIQAYYNAGRKVEAEKLLGAALRKNPKDVDALLQRSRLFVDVGNYVDAQNDLEQVLRFKPDSAEAHYMRAKVYENTGATLQQKQQLNEALRLAPGFLQGRLELAKYFLRSRAPKSALEVLNGAPPSQKNSLLLILQRNWVNLALDDIGEFQKGLNQALTESKAPEVLLQDAHLKFVQRDYPAAQKSLEEVLRQSPDNAQAMDLMVRSYLVQKQPLATAIVKIREHADQHPGSVPARFFLGELLMQNGDRVRARQSFEAAKRADPSFILADQGLAQLDLAERKLDDARKRLLGTLASRTSSETERSVRLQLAAIEQQAENYPAAIQHCRRILELDQDNLRALNDLAYLLVDFANQPAEALKLAERAKEIAPEDAGVADTLGWVFYRKGLYSVALKHLEYASKREAIGLVKCHLAMAYFKLGDQKRGQEALDDAVKLDPTLPQTKVYKELTAETRR